MTRSRRKTPKAGITNSESEKADKRLAARRGRRWVDSHLSAHGAAAEDFDMPDALGHPRSGQWTFGKDGKVWFGHRRGREVEKWLRK